MNPSLRFLFVFLFGLQSIILTAQSDYSLFLKSGTIVLNENIESSVAEQAFDQDEIFNGKIYRLIQFVEIPTQAEQEMLRSQGIELLQYLPKNAFVSSLQVNRDWNSLMQADARSMMRMDALQKTHPQLPEGNFPDYARHGNQVIINVQYYENIPSASVYDALLGKRIEVISHKAAAHTFKVKVDEEELDRVAELPFIFYVEPISEPGQPEDREGRSLHRSNIVNSRSISGRKYDGTGVSIAVNDDGFVGPHIDFTGRTSQTGVANDLAGTHGDMVAGILMGAGNINPSNMGQAPGAFGYIRQYDSDMPNTESTHIADGIMVFSTSYSDGCNGGYTTTTELVDDEIYRNPSIIQVFSAGNSNNNDCGYGAGNQWGNITGGHKQGKNVLACANLFADEILVTSSSRGPAHDGRVKPDIAANGQDQISTDPNNGYSPGGGTSAAAPSVAGCLTQLIHAYRDLNGGANPENALIKSAALNTAYDLGNPGPDYKFGWGRIDTYKALKLLEDGRYMQSSISQGGSNTHSFTIPANVSEARFMIYWTDPAASPATSRALVNDLNMTVDFGGTTYQPLVLNPAANATTLDQNAAPGIDDLNNVEQVRISNPSTGSATINVSGVAVPSGPQSYFVLAEFILDEIEVTYPWGGEHFIQQRTERVRWDAPVGAGPFVLEYSTDNGASWNSISASVPIGRRHFDWFIPNVAATHQALVRVSDGSRSDVSDHAFNVINVPLNLDVTQVCPTTLKLTWDAVADADLYDVFILGNKYMDSIGTTSLLEFDIPISNPFASNWVSVRARTNSGAIGRRANAIEVEGNGLLNCPQSDDVASTSILSIDGSDVQDCYNSSFDVIARIENQGVNPQSNIPVTYQLNGQPPVTEIIPGPLAAGSGIDYQFSVPIAIGAPGSYTLQVWTSQAGDVFTINDSSAVTFNRVASSTVSIPYSQTFDAFANCDDASNCGAEVCGLSGGWINPSNDDHDFRTNSGGTPSVDTGPSNDHTTGTTAGRYLYLEASGGCNEQEAILLSPCLDFTSVAVPELRFWYHMFGGDMGELHLDIFDGEVWIEDIMTPIVGNQGNSWQEVAVNLTAYSGQLATLRFRGITGTDYESDIAIDDINITNLNAPPVSEFSADNADPCVGSVVQFNDQSTSATGWTWNISPSTFTYGGGTNANSQNPLVVFNNSGIYSVELVTTNPFGTDTELKSSFITVNSGQALPFDESFDSFGLCPTTNNCDATPCQTLLNGWVNVENGQGDLIDWRTNSDNTPSSGTGPDEDHTSGSGNYLYLEASNCFGSEAQLISPCLDISGLTPEMSFWYHMLGDDMGELHVDVNSGSGWVNDAIPALVGDQGGSWQEAIVPLSAYIGMTIQVRFRGITGTGWTSDMAIDDINISAVTSTQETDQLEAAISVSPNPSSGLFQVNIDNPKGLDLQAEMYDATGRLLDSPIFGTASAQAMTLDYSDYASGLYFLRIVQGDAIQTIKLVIE